jgi:hypothetical protein
VIKRPGRPTGALAIARHCPTPLHDLHIDLQLTHWGTNRVVGLGLLCFHSPTPTSSSCDRDADRDRGLPLSRACYRPGGSVFLKHEPLES